MMIFTILTSIIAATNLTGVPAAKADDFLRGVYAPYLAGNANVSPTGEAAATIFDGRLTKLIQKDEKEANGEVGTLDYDPICDCQDFERLSSLSIKTSPQGAGHLEAAVRFKNGKTYVNLKYTLTKTAIGWRISDISSKAIPSLVQILGNKSR